MPAQAVAAPEVFVSYSSKDVGLVIPLVRALEAEGMGEDLHHPGICVPQHRGATWAQAHKTQVQVLDFASGEGALPFLHIKR